MQEYGRRRRGGTIVIVNRRIADQFLQGRQFPDSFRIGDLKIRTMQRSLMQRSPGTSLSPFPSQFVSLRSLAVHLSVFLSVRELRQFEEEKRDYEEGDSLVIY